MYAMNTKTQNIVFVKEDMEEKYEDVFNKISDLNRLSNVEIYENIEKGFDNIIQEILNKEIELPQKY